MSKSKPERAGLITAEKLCTLSGLTDRRHRQLADQGYFPPPIRGQYQTSATITGLFRYYKEYSQRHHAAREGIEQEKLREKKRENEEAEGLLVRTADVADALGKSLAKLLGILRTKFEDDMPVAMSSMGIAENRIIGERLFDKLSELFREEFKKWKI